MTNFAHWAYWDSPIGWICISGHGSSIAEVRFMDEAPTVFYNPVPDYLLQGIEELQAYFAGTLRAFTVPIDYRIGTDFQKRVWEELLQIPYGTTTSYLKVAEALGDKKAVRAVGGAVGQNPLPIIIPCHRVIGTGGSLVGFTGGLHRKKALLAVESPNLFGEQPSLFG